MTHKSDDQRLKLAITLIQKYYGLTVNDLGGTDELLGWLREYEYHEIPQGITALGNRYGLTKIDI